MEEFYSFSPGDWVTTTTKLTPGNVKPVPVGTLLQIVGKSEQTGIYYVALNGTRLNGGWFSHRFVLVKPFEEPSPQLSFDF